MGDWGGCETYVIYWFIWVREETFGSVWQAGWAVQTRTATPQSKKSLEYSSTRDRRQLRYIFIINNYYKSHFDGCKSAVHQLRTPVWLLTKQKDGCRTSGKKQTRSDALFALFFTLFIIRRVLSSCFWPGVNLVKNIWIKSATVPILVFYKSRFEY